MKKLLMKLLMCICTLAVVGIVPEHVKAGTNVGELTSFNDHYYQFIDKSATAEDAINACKKMGGHLVTITSEDEQKFLTDYVAKGTMNHYWIGLVNGVDGYQWITGESKDYTNWAACEPSNNFQYSAIYRENYFGGNNRKYAGQWNDLENDAVKSSEDTWNGYYCIDKVGYICEWESCLISVSKKNLVMDVGDNVVLSCQTLDEKAKVKFSSNKKTVAKVSSKGKVVAVAPGTCEISCSTGGNITVKVKVTVLPQKVKELAKVSATSNSITLKWEKQDGVTGYSVYMYDTDLEEYTKVKSVKSSKTSCKITDLEKNTSYKFKVRAYVKSGSKTKYGEYSNTIKVKTTK